jgi:hypothetical protein
VPKWQRRRSGRAGRRPAEARHPRTAWEEAAAQRLLTSAERRAERILEEGRNEAVRVRTRDRARARELSRLAAATRDRMAAAPPSLAETVRAISIAAEDLDKTLDVLAGMGPPPDAEPPRARAAAWPLPSRRVLASIAYWTAVVAVSLALVVALILFLESRDISSLQSE